MARKYSPEAGKKVKRAMHEMKEGKLTSGRSKKKVTNPKQAVAIGLSEARKKGGGCRPRRSKLAAAGRFRFSIPEDIMAEQSSKGGTATIERPQISDGEIRLTRQELIANLNDDLAREYQAIIAYVVYSQVLKGAQYMSIAAELEKHAGEELPHALIISKQIDYLGGMPTVTPKPVKTSEKAEDMLRFDLDNENETIRNYRERVRAARGARRVRPGRTHPRNPGR